MSSTIAVRAASWLDAALAQTEPGSVGAITPA